MTTSSSEAPGNASRWFESVIRELDRTAQHVVARVMQRRSITEDPNRRIDATATFGERTADRVAAFGGSWTFIGLFALVLVGWTVLNSEILGKTAFDPYPFIFLNLMLSMLAAIQAPVIMMSQNRQSAKDRQMAAYDYEVNLKAELEIMSLHTKVDALRTEQLMTIVEQQQAQIAMLTRLIESRQG